MYFVSAFILIAMITFAAFCFYSGVSSIGEKIKKDGFYSALEVAVLSFLVTALVILAVGRVRNVLFQSVIEPSVIRVENVSI